MGRLATLAGSHITGDAPRDARKVVIDEPEPRRRFRPDARLDSVVGASGANLRAGVGSNTAAIAPS
jgi:hypothetical protein